MITINLLPQNLRKPERRMLLPNKAYLAWAIIVFAALHLCFFSLNMVKKIQWLALNKNWAKFEPQAKDFAAVRKKINDLETRVKSVEAALTRKVGFTEVVSSLNMAVPRGLWLERFSLTEGGLLIQGSVVSLSQNEMTIIGKFLQELKNNKTFSSAFSKIELSSVQRRTIKAYDIVDFVLAGVLKN